MRVVGFVSRGRWRVPTGGRGSLTCSQLPLLFWLLLASGASGRWDTHSARASGLSRLPSKSLRHPISWLLSEFRWHSSGAFPLARFSLHNLSAIQWATATPSNEICLSLGVGASAQFLPLALGAGAAPYICLCLLVLVSTP